MPISFDWISNPLVCQFSCPFMARSVAIAHQVLNWLALVISFDNGTAKAIKQGWKMLRSPSMSAKPSETRVVHWSGTYPSTNLSHRRLTSVKHSLCGDDTTSVKDRQSLWLCHNSWKSGDKKTNKHKWSPEAWALLRLGLKNLVCYVPFNNHSASFMNCLLIYISLCFHG